MTPVILTLSRHGVALAHELADAMHGATDVLGVQKLHLPWRDDVCMGAIVENGDAYLDQRFIDVLRIDDTEVASECTRAYEALVHRVEDLRGDHLREDLHDRTVVVVGDDHATPGTVAVAIRAARADGANRVILAIPERAPNADAILERTRDDADEILRVA